MKNTRIFLSIVLCTSFHLCNPAPLWFIYDQQMAQAAEKIIERSNNKDAAVTHVKRGHVDEYSCNDATGQYRVQVDAHKKTVSIGWGTSDHNFPFVLLITPLITPQELLEQHDVLAKGGTVTKKYGHDNTVTKMWRKKSGEIAYWNSAVLPLETCKEFAKEKREGEAQFAAVLKKHASTKEQASKSDESLVKGTFDFASPVKPFVKDEGKVNVKQHASVDLSIMHNKFVIDGHSDNTTPDMSGDNYDKRFMAPRSSRIYKFF